MTVDQYEVYKEEKGMLNGWYRSDPIEYEKYPDDKRRIVSTPPPSPIREDERTEYYNQLTKNLGKTQPYHYTGTKCVPQCENLPHYETKHHKDCPFYKNSLSEKYDKIAPPSPVGIDVEGDIISLAESIIDRVACEASTMDVVNMILDYIASLPQSSTEEEKGKRMFTLEEMKDCWNVCESNQLETINSQKKKQYFKQKFNIDL